MNYAIHPVADIFPMMDEASFQDLVDDIKAHGLIEPVVLVRNVIVDGRNRLKACEAAGVAPRYREIQAADPVAYIISTNLHRRHLTTAQRAAIAADLATMANGTNRFEKKHNVNIGGPNDPPINAMTTEQAAQLMNVSTKSVKRAKARKHQDPAAHEAVKRGEKVSNQTESTESNMGTKKGAPSAKNGWRRIAILAYQETTGSLLSSSWIDANVKPELERRLQWFAEIHGTTSLTDDQASEVRSVVIDIAKQLGHYRETNTEKAPQDIAAIALEASSGLPAKDLSPLDIAIAAHKRVLDMQIEERIKERLQAALDMYCKEYDRYKAFNSAWKGFLTDDEYRLVISCLHPDRAPPDRLKQYEKAFHIVKSKEDIFLSAKKDPNETTMPRTVEELMARRKAH